MATFDDLRNGLEEAFDSEGAKGVEATIQINIEDLTNFFVLVTGFFTTYLPHIIIFIFWTQVKKKDL